MSTLPATLPSTFDLSRYYNELWVRLIQIDAARVEHYKDELSEAYRVANTAWDRLHDDATAVDNLILTRPVESMRRCPDPPTMAGAAVLALRGAGDGAAV